LKELDSLQEILGFSFEDISHLQRALVHRSHLNEASGSALESNERLEFLGDALLGLVIAEELYRRFPDFQEGDLTRLRSALVRTETLAGVARSLQLGDYLQLGRGEEETGGRNKQRNLACVLEAVIGAVFIDQGFDMSKEFILRILDSEFETAIEGNLESDPKSKLQELIQARDQITPAYRTIDSFGPDHDKVFTVEVLANDIVLGQGAGTSKQRAEQEAARAALEKLKEEGN